MKGKIRLRPGIPDDDNRDYLPEKLKDGIHTVNENGNDSQIYPERLKKYRDFLVDGVEDTWYEYVPECYDPAKKTPLVVSCHGGLMTGWGQAVYTSWTLVADREGFIVVFPDAFENRVWMLECDWEKVVEASKDMPPEVPMLPKPETRVEDYHDVRKIAALIEKMKEKYRIDPGRIYLQGMSMGNAAASQFARYLGHLLAGAAGSGCPTNTALLFDEGGRAVNRGGPLAVWQSRLELDQVPPHYREGNKATIAGNIAYWNQVNGCRKLPQIRIEGNNNLAFFEGENGVTVFMEVKNRDHGQTFDDAELVWDYLFSGCYKDENRILRKETPQKKREGDGFGAAIVEGSSRAFVNGHMEQMEAQAFRWRKLKYHGLKGNALVRSEYLYAPVSFLAKLFQAEVEISEEGAVADLTLKDGTCIQFAGGNTGCVVDNRIEAMYCEGVVREGILFISSEWFAERFYGMHTSFCEGVLYMTDHKASLSRNMAYLIQDITTS